MKIIITQQILLKNRPNTFRQILKEFESDSIPHKGDYIYDTAFKDPHEYEVASVTIDYEYNKCHVMLRCIELETDNENAVKEYIEMTKLHGWVCNTL